MARDRRRGDPVASALAPYIGHLERSLARLRSEWTTYRYSIVASSYRVKGGQDGRVQITTSEGTIQGIQRGDVLRLHSSTIIDGDTVIEGTGPRFMALLSVTLGDLERASGPRDVEWLLETGHRDLRLDGGRVIGTDPSSSTITLSKVPSMFLEAGPNAIDVIRELGALRSLASTDDDRFAPLRRIVSGEGEWPSFIAPRIGDGDFLLLTDDSVPGVERQRAFVEKALTTPDIMLLEGPPGSGKTTVLSELVVQSVMRGDRVLMVASTHVAVDNLLERLIDREDDLSGRAGLIPLRIGVVGNVSPIVAPYTVKEVVRTERERIAGHLRSIERSPAQDHMLEYLEGNEGRRSALEELVIDSANLVCGTTIGVLGSKVVAASGGFDLIIIDEASKTTLQEFMVPAMLGSRWVIAGDRMQLSPYVDEDRNVWELRSMSDDVKGFDPHVREDRLAALADMRHEELPMIERDGWEREVGWRMRRMHELRDDPRLAERYAREMDALVPPGRIGTTIREGMRSVERIAFMSIVDVVLDNVPERALERRRTLLDHQYRMHPSLSALPRACIYGERALRDPPDMASKREWSFPGARLSWLDVPGRRRSRDESPEEANAVVDVVDGFSRWAIEDGGRWDVAILTPYRAQERLIRSSMDRRFERDGPDSYVIGDMRARIATVDRYQGHEADLVVLSMVRGIGQGVGFMDSRNRSNVALTRARYMLVVVGDRGRFLADDSPPMLRRLASEAGGWY